MQGRLIFINPNADSGLIFGADRSRYRFDLSEWRGGPLPKRNTMLKFEAAGDAAIAVYNASESPAPGLAETVITTPRTSKLRGRAKAKPAADLDDAILLQAAPQPATAPASPLTAGIETDDTLDILDLPVGAGPAAAPGLNLSAALTARLLLTEEGVRRSPLKPIVIGLGLTVVLILCGVLFTYLHGAHP